MNGQNRRLVTRSVRQLQPEIGPGVHYISTQICLSSCTDVVLLKKNCLLLIGLACPAVRH